MCAVAASKISIFSGLPMALGGARPGTGRKSVTVEHVLVMPATQPERFAQLEEAGELTADEQCP